MTDKKISLITTTKDRPEMLMDAALSVHGQTFKPYEWIVVVDGLTRGYSKVLKYIRNLQPEVKIKIIKPGDAGRVKALIIAHLQATGDYIGWLDDDDWLHSACLEKFNQAQGNFIYCDYYQYRKGMDLIESPYIDEDYSYERFIQTGNISHFVLYSKELYEHINGLHPTNFPQVDIELYARMLKLVEATKIKEHLYYHRIHHDRITKRNAKQSSRRFRHIQQVYGTM